MCPRSKALAISWIKTHSRYDTANVDRGMKGGIRKGGILKEGGGGVLEGGDFQKGIEDTLWQL